MKSLYLWKKKTLEAYGKCRKEDKMGKEKEKER